MVQVSSGVNELQLDLAGQSISNVKSQLASVLNLGGDESVKVNGNAVDGNYVLRDGDEVEFVKVSGTKGSVEISAGVNTMDLDVAGKTVGEVRGQLASVLNIDSTWSAEVNGSAASETATLRDGDELEFVKQSGTKGRITVHVHG